MSTRHTPSPLRHTNRPASETHPGAFEADDIPPQGVSRAHSCPGCGVVKPRTSACRCFDCPLNVSVLSEDDQARTELALELLEEVTWEELPILSLEPFQYSQTSEDDSIHPAELAQLEPTEPTEELEVAQLEGLEEDLVRCAAARGGNALTLPQTHSLARRFRALIGRGQRHGQATRWELSVERHGRTTHFTFIAPDSARQPGSLTWRPESRVWLDESVAQAPERAQLERASDGTAKRWAQAELARLLGTTARAKAHR